VDFGRILEHVFEHDSLQDEEKSTSMNFFIAKYCIVRYIKLIKSDKICRFENTHTSSTCLAFLYSPKYKVFEHDSLQVSRINS
jgi:hypothetical protein